MRTVKAKIELGEDELLAILAEYFEAKPTDISFNVIEMQRDTRCVNAVIAKEIVIPAKPVESRNESAYEHYCPNNL